MFTKLVSRRMICDKILCTSYMQYTHVHYVAMVGISKYGFITILHTYKTIHIKQCLGGGA